MINYLRCYIKVIDVGMDYRGGETDFPFLTPRRFDPQILLICADYDSNNKVTKAQRVFLKLVIACHNQKQLTGNRHGN